MRLPRRPRGYRNLFVLILFLAVIIIVSISMFTIGVYNAYNIIIKFIFVRPWTT